MSLEEVLKILEHDSGERRDPEKYYFSIFGEPKDTGTWGFRVEGHHLSLNFTVAAGRSRRVRHSSAPTPPRFAKGRARDCGFCMRKKTWPGRSWR